MTVSPSASAATPRARRWRRRSSPAPVAARRARPSSVQRGDDLLTSHPWAQWCPDIPGRRTPLGPLRRRPGSTPRSTAPSATGGATNSAGGRPPRRRDRRLRLLPRDRWRPQWRAGRPRDPAHLPLHGARARARTRPPRRRCRGEGAAHKAGPPETLTDFEYEHVLRVPDRAITELPAGGSAPIRQTTRPRHRPAEHVRV